MENNVQNVQSVQSPEIILKQIFDLLKKASVDYNYTNEAYWGVLHDEQFLYVPSPYFFIRINVSNHPDILKILSTRPNDKPFFSFLKNEWVPYPFIIPLQTMLSIFQHLNFVGKVFYPYAKLMNAITQLTDSERQKTRLILNNQLHQLEKNEDLIIKFDTDLTFKHPLLNKICVIADNSNIPKHMIVPGRLYRAKIIGETDAYYLLNVLELFGLKLGINYSPAGFIPDNLEVIESLKHLPPDKIITTTKVEILNPNVRIANVHLDCTMVFDILRVFALFNSINDIAFFISSDPNHPVLIQSINDIIIEALIATLNPFYGIQRR